MTNTVTISPIIINHITSLKELRSLVDNNKPRSDIIELLERISTSNQNFTYSLRSIGSQRFMSIHTQLSQLGDTLDGLRKLNTTGIGSILKPKISKQLKELFKLIDADLMQAYKINSSHPAFTNDDLQRERTIEALGIATNYTVTLKNIKANALTNINNKTLHEGVAPWMKSTIDCIDAIQSMNVGHIESNTLVCAQFFHNLVLGLRQMMSFYKADDSRFQISLNTRHHVPVEMQELYTKLSQTLGIIPEDNRVSQRNNNRQR